MESRLLCASTPTAPNIPGSWNLAFNDNFSSINSKVWSNTYEWGGTQGTQATFSPSALSTSSNGLSITAKNVPSTSSTGVTNPYTSGVLTTAGTTGGADGVKPPGFTFTYGYVQTTMEAAPGLGMWSAIWMLPESYSEHYELDLAEIIGRQPTNWTATYHWGSNYWQPPGAVPVNLTTSYNTYGVDWEPNSITWYFNGVSIGSYTNASEIVNSPMYLILNLDVGGSWAGPLGSSSPASSTWNIQNVQVWQHPGDTSTSAVPVTGGSTALSQVNLSSAFNTYGIVADGSNVVAGQGLDGSGTALSANLLGSSQTWNGNPYTIGSVSGDNVVTAAGQTIALPQGSYASLSFLGMAIYGAQTNQTFVVHYTDGSTQTFTQSVSDWSAPQGFAGESTAISVPYIDYGAGSRDNNTFHVYAYQFSLNSAKTVASITLPSNGHLQIIAMDLTTP